MFNKLVIIAAGLLISGQVVLADIAPATQPAPTTSQAPAVHEINGKHWSFPVIARWEAEEQENGVMVASPDHLYAYCSAVDFNTQAATVEEVAKGYIEKLRGRNVKVMDSKPGITKAGDTTLEVEVSFDTEYGQFHMWIGAGLIKANGRNIATICFAMTPESEWNGAGPPLKNLATQIHAR